MGGGEGGQAETDVFKLAEKVKRRRRRGETSPKAAFIKTLPGSELKSPLCHSLGWYPVTGLSFST